MLVNLQLRVRGDDRSLKRRAHFSSEHRHVGITAQLAYKLVDPLARDRRDDQEQIPAR
jgi:hypothetical protein